MIRSARDELNACASVLATMKSTPARPETIMLFTALPPAPPTPHTMIRGFNSRNSGAFKLIVILGLLTLDARRRRLNHDISSYKDTFPGSDAARCSRGLRNFPSTTDRPARHSHIRRRLARSPGGAARNARCPPLAGRPSDRPLRQKPDSWLIRAIPRRQADDRCESDLKRSCAPTRASPSTGRRLPRAQAAARHGL